MTECRPPPEHETDRWHWLINQDGETRPAAWVSWESDAIPMVWFTIGFEDHAPPRVMAVCGWRWLAVARPPAHAETPIPKPAAGQVWRSPKPRVADRVVVRIG